MRAFLACAVLMVVSSGAASALERGTAGSIDRFAWCHDKLLDCDSNIKTGCDSRYPNDPAGYKQCMSDSYAFCNEAWATGASTPTLWAATRRASRRAGSSHERETDPFAYSPGICPCNCRAACRCG